MKITSRVSISIHDVTGKEFAFKNLSQLYKFLEQEEKFWRLRNKEVGAKGRGNQHPYFSCVSRLKEMREIIDSWRSHLPDWDEEQLIQQISSLQQSYDSFLHQEWLWSAHPFTDTFIVCNKKYGRNSARAFVGYILDGDFTLRNKPEFLGSMLAYEYSHRDFHIKSRREGEERSLVGLRDQLFAQLKELQDKVQFNTERGERQNLEQRKAFDDLEQKYEEKLRLSKPAEYWKKAATEHENQGKKAVKFLFIWLSIGLVALGYFFVCWLQGIEASVNLETWQGVVLFGSFMAVFAFSVRVLARLTFSSFHLMRDAQEREQLTYLYLSLAEADPSEKESRDIVLRALFSRSQTGLLTNERGPHMLNEVARVQNSN